MSAGNKRFQLLDTNASAIVPEQFGTVPLCLEGPEDPGELGDDLFDRNRVLHFRVESATKAVAADVESVFRAATADDADLALVGPRTTVRAARHADADGFTAETEVSEDSL